MKISKFIGQTNAVASLNEIVAAKEYAEAKGKEFHFRPILFKGLTGLGKTELSKLFGNCMGMQFLELPANAGWGEMGKIAEKMSSFDDETKTFSAIPSTIFIDEAHSQKVLADLIKVLFNDKKGTNHISRNGRDYFYDPRFHLVIFASNRTLDAALEGRCYKLQLVPYTKPQKIQLIKIMGAENGNIFSDEAAEILESRVKPTAREIKDLVYPFSLLQKEKIDGKTALEKAKEKGFFPLGLRPLDIQLIKRIAEGSATAAVLKHIAQDDKKRDTQDKIDWLIALGLVAEGRGGFTVTKEGGKYFEKLRELKAGKTTAKK